MAPPEIFKPTNGSNMSSNNSSSNPPYRLPTAKTMSPTHQQQTNPFETDLGMSSLSLGAERAAPRQEADMTISAIRIRRIPLNKTNEDLRNMLLFTNDLVTVDFIPSNLPEDHGYQTAIARFQTSGTAHEAQTSLHGKQTNANDPPIVVEVIRVSPSGGGSRNHLDQSAYRANSNSSNASSSGQQARQQASRFNAAFQPMDSMPAPNGNHAYPNGAPSSGELASPRGTYFPPQSPIDQRQRVSGKAVIGEDGVDEDPTDLLNNPVAYAEGDMPSLSRRSTNNNPGIPTSRWAGLSLLATSNPASPPLNNFSPPRNGNLQSPTSMAMSPTMNFGPSPNFQISQHPHYQRHQLPPVNPADQNPPCNTLYVGNLPIDTSEDELKTLFSKQRGYKRLCFRTKQNGPMCFVEFEDTTFATKSLDELYGYTLHNSVKGGIRLSFSKNPLGVRNGQPGGMGPMSPLSPTGGPMAHGIGGGNFSTAHGPPPGLSAPPGLAHHNNVMNGMNGMMSPTTGMNTINMGYGSPTSVGPASMGMGMNPPVNGAWGQQTQFSQSQSGLFNGVQQGPYRGVQQVQQRGILQGQQHRGVSQGQYGGDQQGEYDTNQQKEPGEDQQSQHSGTQPGMNNGGGQQGLSNGSQQGPYQDYGYGR